MKFNLSSVNILLLERIECSYRSERLIYTRLSDFFEARSWKMKWFMRKFAFRRILVTSEARFLKVPYLPSHWAAMGFNTTYKRDSTAATPDISH